MINIKDGFKMIITVVCLMLATAIVGFVAGYDYHASKAAELKVDSGKSVTYTVTNYENGITMKDGYNMSIHRMQEYVTEDEHCGGLHISDKVIE